MGVDSHQRPTAADQQTRRPEDHRIQAPAALRNLELEEVEQTHLGVVHVAAERQQGTIRSAFVVASILVADP